MAGTWIRLAHAELSSAGDTINTGDFTPKDNLIIIAHLPSDGNLDNCKLFLGTGGSIDTGSNYAFRHSTDGAGDGVNGSMSGYWFTVSNIDAGVMLTANITNIADKEKLIQSHAIMAPTGAGTAPHRAEVAGKWDDTSGQINTIRITNSGTGDFEAGSYITVFGASDDIVTDEKATLADATVDQTATQSYNSTTTNVTLSNSNLTATSTSTAWGNRAYSTLSYNPSNLTSGQTYEFKFTMGDITKNGFMGFDSTPTTISGHGNDNNASGVDYGFYLVGNGSSNNYLAVSEQGTEKWQSSSNFITSNTIFKITVDSSGVVKYYADTTDGTTLRYTSGTAMSGDFYVLFYPYDSGFTTTISSWSNGLETISVPPPDNTRYEETDTRKIYRWSTGGTDWSETGTGSMGFQTVKQSGWEGDNGIIVPSSMAGKKVKTVAVKMWSQNSAQSPVGTFSCHIYNGTTLKAQSGTVSSGDINVGTNMYASGFSSVTFTFASPSYALVTGDYIVISSDTTRSGGGYVQTVGIAHQGTGTDRYYRTGATGSFSNSNSGTVDMVISSADEWVERNTV